MVESTIKTTTQVTLTMDQTEARWLKNLMQNSINTAQDENEEEINFDIRKRFWDALSDV